MQRQQERAKCRGTNLSQAVGTFTSDLETFVFGKTLYEHEFTLRSKVLDAEKSTASNLLIFITKASIEEG